MKIHYLLILYLIIFFHLPAHEIKVTGIATNHHGKIIYKEIHHKTYNGEKLMQIKSEFFSKDGQLIEKISSDFSKSLTLPDYHLINYQADEEEILTKKSNQVEILFRKKRNKNFHSKMFDIHSNDVSGFGIFEFIGSHLDRLSQGEVVHATLIAVPRLSSFSITLKKGEIEDFSDPNQIGVILELNDSLLKIFVPQTRLVFDKSTKRILYYEGLSNVVNPHGTRPRVEVNFSYEN